MGSKKFLYGEESIKEFDSSADRVVRCNNCMQHYYETAGGYMDSKHLQILHDEDDLNKEDPYKGCGNCLTDEYITDIDDEQET